jgi:transcriptional regulator with XRE-family HTH domain
MICDYCDKEMSARKTTPDLPYLYRASGLSNVVLIGITVRKCEKCGAEVPVIPHIAELHNVIALDIVNQAGPLSGEKIRFLRKYAGFPAQKFARLLGVTPEHLSRVENGHEAKLGDPTDRLVRALALTARNTEEIRKILLSVADKLEKKARTKPEALRFKLKKSGGWAAAA